MPYEVIRVSCGCEVVVVELNEGGKKRYFHIDDYKTNGFEEITKDEAEGFFSHLADGMGFGEIPDRTFNSLEKILEWKREKQREWAKTRTDDVDEDEFEELRDHAKRLLKEKK